MFMAMPARRAILVAFLGAWLFLPVFGYKLPGFPDYTKVTATSLAVALCTVLFDSARLFSFRPRWFDLPMLVWCCVPFASAVSTGYGAYEGLSGVFTCLVMWAIPYFIGRIYFSDLSGAKEIALAIVIGAVVYVPFCWWEIRMSPGLHRFFYGFHQHSIVQTRRLGGYRPMVFMQHGLAVGLFMSLGTLLSLWCWTSGSFKRIWNIPASWITAVLALTSVLCKSTGAILILMAGCGVWFGARYVRTPLVMVLIVAVPIGYMSARTVGGWKGQELIEGAAMLGSAQADSLQFRINSENGVWDIIRRGDALLGSSRFSYSGEKTEASNNQKIIGDGMWIIALGKYGVLGLFAWAGALILPGLGMAWKVPARTWGSAAIAPAAALAVIGVLYLWDSMMNAMVNPVWLVAMGSAMGCAFQRRVETGRQGVRPVQIAPPPPPGPFPRAGEAVSS
jgi:hypothetical protein